MPNKFTKQNTNLLAEIRKVIKNEMKKRDFALKYEVFNTKHLEQCPRRLYYRVNALYWDEIEECCDYSNDYDVEYAKNKWMDLFINSKNISVIDRKVMAADTNYNIAGLIDGVLICEDVVFVVLIDRLRSEDYDKAKEEGGSRRQIVELIANLWLTEIQNGILICENRETNNYFSSHTIAYRPIVESIKSKCLNLMEKKIMQQTPPRPYKQKNSKECEICEYKDYCWTT